MLTRKIIGISAALLLVLAVGLTSCGTLDLQSLQGMIKNVDSLSGNVTVTLKDGTTTTFNLADIDLQAVKDSIGNISVDAGDNVSIRRDNHGKVTCLIADKAEIEGVIKTIGADTITITTEENGDITLKVTAGTLIISKTAGTVALSSLTAGQKVEARYDSTTMQAVKLKIDFENNGNQKHENRQQQNIKTQNQNDNQWQGNNQKAGVGRGNGNKHD